jgi:cytochrome c oxidase assembly factor CtaG
MVNSALGPPPLSPGMLRIVRYAMLVLLLVFGAFGYYQSTHRMPDPESMTNLPALQWVGYAMCAMAMVGIAVLRQVRERAEEDRRPTLGLIGSALAEGAALFGGVYMVLGGGITVYAVALIIFLATWSLLPADSAET